MKPLALALLIAATLPASAQQRFAVTPQQVAQALLRRGLPVAEDRISLVASIVAATAEPDLVVEAMQPLAAIAPEPRIRTQVKLTCPQPRACVPFYAIVTWPVGTLPSNLPVLARAAQPPAAIAIHAGSPAMLLVDTGQMHLRIPVVSLQNGALGSTIHVASPDHKQTYTATVLSPTTLTGSI
jgi:hypothetical protein